MGVFQVTNVDQTHFWRARAQGSKIPGVFPQNLPQKLSLWLWQKGILRRVPFRLFQRLLFSFLFFLKFSFCIFKERVPNEEKLS